MSLGENYLTSGRPGKHECLFLPLGGCNEIGMNLNLFGHDGKWLMVDMGVTFGDDSQPGIDVIMPNPDFIEARKDELVGLVLTHAHEDHLGAIPYLWGELRCPIYATEFTALFLQKKLEETNFKNDVPIHIIKPNERFTLDVFDLEYITLTHSIPEPNALVIRTKAGMVFHTGDWKIDPDPQLGEPIDESRLIALKEEGVMAMTCDSTNALKRGHSLSEGVVADGLAEVIKSLKGKIAVGCFASNVARLRSIALAGLKVGRHPALIGRSLWRMEDTARKCGFLHDIPAFLDDKAIKGMKDDEYLVICTGSQGEPRAALTRIARGDHPSLKLVKGDHVLFSSREIPGNELAIGRLQNSLAQKGVEIITAEEYEIHASGHPYRDELMVMYDWIRPKSLIPVHGESRHLIAQAELAKSCQIQYSLVPENGMMIDLAAKDGPKQIDLVFSGRLALSGKDLVPMDHDSLSQRRKLSQEGVVMISLALSKRGGLKDVPLISTLGLMELDYDEQQELIDLLFELFSDQEGRKSNKTTKASKGKNFIHNSDYNLSDAERVRVTTRRFYKATLGLRPQIMTHFI